MGEKSSKSNTLLYWINNIKEMEGFSGRFLDSIGNLKQYQKAKISLSKDKLETEEYKNLKPYIEKFEIDENSLIEIEKLFILNSGKQNALIKVLKNNNYMIIPTYYLKPMINLV